MKKIGTILGNALFEWPSGGSLGVALSTWFGIYLMISYFWVDFRTQYYFNFLPPYTRLVSGILLLSLSIYVILRPKTGTLGPTYIICSLQVINIIISGDYGRSVVWILVAAFATWGVFEKMQFLRISDAKRPSEEDDLRGINERKNKSEEKN